MFYLVTSKSASHPVDRNRNFGRHFVRCAACAACGGKGHSGVPRVGEKDVCSENTPSSSERGPCFNSCQLRLGPVPTARLIFLPHSAQEIHAPWCSCRRPRLLVKFPRRRMPPPSKVLCSQEQLKPPRHRALPVFHSMLRRHRHVTADRLRHCHQSPRPLANSVPVRKGKHQRARCEARDKRGSSRGQGAMRHSTSSSNPVSCATISPRAICTCFTSSSWSWRARRMCQHKKRGA